MSKTSQAERIHEILLNGGTVSSFDGRIDGREAYGILDVPKRISELRGKYGKKYILDEWREVKPRSGTTRVKIYRINRKEIGQRVFGI